MKILTLCALLCLAGCCEYKHDGQKQLDLYERCIKLPTAYDARSNESWCEVIAENASRIGECK